MSTNKRESVSRSNRSRAVLIFLIIFFCCCLPFAYYSLFPRESSHFPPSDPNESRLLQILRKASMPSRTVIVTIVDKSWAKRGSVLDIFLETFRIGEGTKHLLNHLVIVALDIQAFEYCESIHSSCYTISKPTISTITNTSPTYPSLFLHSKNQIFTQVLKWGYNLLYTDADVMWLKNPFPLFDVSKSIAIRCNSTSNNQANRDKVAKNGFFYMRSDVKNIEFIEVLYPHTRYYSLCDMIKQRELVELVGLEIKYIETEHYGSFCYSGNSKNIKELYCMQADCCDWSLDNKIYDMKLFLQEFSDPVFPLWKGPMKCLVT